MDGFREKNILLDIKCKYIIEEVLSFLHEKEKLNLIIHNKQLQKAIGINIDHYKYYKVKRGNYKIVEANGKGKEYDINTNILLFEGEYSNGERNGKGKLYNSIGKLIFEGEYLNGIKNGNGIEYNYNNKLMFEGEYLEGKRWNVKGYDINGNIECEIKDGKGYIKEYNYYGQLEFEGEYLNGERDGKGKEYYDNGVLMFEGEYSNGKRWNVKGYNINGNIECEIKDGKGNIKEYNYYGKLEFEG